MKHYIDKDDLLSYLFSNQVEYIGFALEIARFPSIELVCCKECKQRKSNNRCARTGYYTGDSDYCSWGARAKQ